MYVPVTISPLGRQAREKQSADPSPSTTAYDKQKDLLSSETGHFSLIRAMHLADLITELNGTSSPTVCGASSTS